MCCAFGTVVISDPKRSRRRQIYEGPYQLFLCVEMCLLFHSLLLKLQAEWSILLHIIFELLPQHGSFQNSLPQSVWGSSLLEEWNQHIIISVTCQRCLRALLQDVQVENSTPGVVGLCWCCLDVIWNKCNEVFCKSCARGGVLWAPWKACRPGLQKAQEQHSTQKVPSASS